MPHHQIDPYGFVDSVPGSLTFLQNWFASRGIGGGAWIEARKLLLTSRQLRPYRNALSGPDAFTSSGFLDLLFHPYDHPYQAASLRQWVEESQLQLAAYQRPGRHVNETGSNRFGKTWDQWASDEIGYSASKEALVCWLQKGGGKLDS